MPVRLQCDAGRETAITDPGSSNQVAYTYDAANRLSTVTDWNSHVTTYAYDDANRMTTATLPDGVVSTSTYDNANRLTGISHVKGSTTLASVAYTVGAVGNRSDRTDLAGTQTCTYYGSVVWIARPLLGEYRSDLVACVRDTGCRQRWDGFFQSASAPDLDQAVLDAPNASPWPQLGALYRLLKTIGVGGAGQLWTPKTGNHLGTADPQTGDMTKGPVSGRDIHDVLR